jgi:hypothetical protein
MKKPGLILNKNFNHKTFSTLLNLWRKLPGLMMAGAVLLAMGLLAPLAQAQTNATITTYQIHFEVPEGYVGTNFYNYSVAGVGTNFTTLRISTNGLALDVNGSNWDVGPLTVGISGAPAGVGAYLADQSSNIISGPMAVNGGTTMNLTTNNASTSTNMFLELTFDGTEAAGSSTLSLNVSGTGVPNLALLLPLDIGKIWNGSTNAAVDGAGNWSDPSQWLNTGAPGPNDDVVFTGLGLQTNSLVSTATSTNYLANSVIDAPTTISSLRFSQTNGANNYYNLYINDGQSLAIKGNNGFSMLRDITYYSPSKMFVTLWGTNGTFIVTNENANFSMLIDGGIASTLDMSGLGNVHLDVNRLAIGDTLAYPNYTNLLANSYKQNGTTIGASMPMRILPTWKMAMTNYVRAVYVDPYNYTNAFSRSYAMEIGRNNYGGGSSGSDHVLDMGSTNYFYMDSICVAGYASLGGVMQFLNNNSYALFRNTNGGRMSIFATADAAETPAYNIPNGILTGDNTKAGPVDFTKGYVDMLVDRFYLSRDGGNVAYAGKGDSQTAFAMAQGIIDANTAILGFQNEGNQTNTSYCYATMVVSNTAVFKVNDTLALGYTTCTADNNSVQSASSGYGQIAIGPGGTVMANNITVGGVTKLSAKNQITLTGGASLIVSNGIADSNEALGTLSLGGNCSLTLFINGANPAAAFVYVTNLTASGTGNQLIIGGVQNLSYPAYIPLIAGAGSTPISAAAFDAGVVMPEGSGLHGTLVTSSSNTVDLEIIARTPNHLLWRAPAGGSGTADWDYTTKNWLDQNTGLMTNYDNPDIVAFDDAPGYATNINIAGGTAALTPGVINMTNSALYYTFLDGGNSILGGPTLNKYGTGAVEIDGNTTMAAQLNQGALNGTSSGSVGGVTVAAGAVMNYAGAIGGSVNCSGTGTSSGSISGTLSVLTGGVYTNSGALANPFLVQTNGLFYNSASGYLNNIGAGSSGSPQVARGGTFINNGSIGVIAGGGILYVNGTFEDLGGGSDNMTLQSVTVGAGGTFIPGGNGTGTTTINNDGSATFDGAALLVQGSTNIFYVNPGGSPLNTVLTCAHLSFGSSASQQTQNGCTLVINNIGSAFTAGQSFALFNNVESSGSVPFNTGSSTNTYPAISPATPGAGLAWDLTHLWVNGSIGVVSANSGITLTNSFGGDGTGTNIVGQFSWDPSLMGYRLETKVTPNTVGLSPSTNYNWTGIAGSQTNTTMMITNVINATNDVFFRLTFP